MKRLAAVLLLCSCGHPRPESPAESYQRILSTFRSGGLDEALAQARLASKRCGPDVRCQVRLRLLQAEILTQKHQDDVAGALLSQSLPGGPDFVALELRRRMLLGYLLSFSPDGTKAEAGRKLLDDAYQEAAGRAVRDLLPEMEILKGNLLWARDLEKARALFLEAKQHAIEQQDPYDEGAALIDLGMIAVKRSRYDEAIPFFEQSLDRAKRIGARPMVTVAYNNLALCHTQLGAYDEALKLQQEALAWYGTSELPVVHRDLLGEMGRTLEFEGQLQEAIKYYRQALTLARSLKGASDTWISANNLASALAATGDWDAAGKANQEELALAHDDRSKAYATLNAATIAAGRKRFDEAMALYRTAIRVKVDDPSILWDSYAGLATAYVAAGNKPLARTYFERTIEIIDKNQTGLSRDEYKMTFLSSLIRFYREYVEFLMQSGDSDRALEVVESSRARILAETLADRKPARPLSAGDLQKAASRAGRVFLSYWLAPIQSYVWVISTNRIEHIALGPAAAIESLVETSRHSVVGWDLAAKDSSDARRLYEAVLRPVAPLLPRNARVVIVPDGALHYLNFETLPVYEPKPHYWIEDATVAVAPSLAIAAAAPVAASGRYKSLLIIGAALPSGRDYPRLAYAPDEIGKVGSHFAQEKKFTGPDATPAAYRQASSQPFSVIHFSAHGEANSQSPLDSAIILSPKDGAFKLYAHDIIDGPLHADLVTISACRSAGARVYSGEGLVGFAWAFLKAGAHYVVAGLWDVSDSPAPAMMDQFYGAIEAGRNPVDALRLAKLTMIHSAKAIRKPYYWGPFQIYIR